MKHCTVSFYHLRCCLSTKMVIGLHYRQNKWPTAQDVAKGNVAQVVHKLPGQWLVVLSEVRTRKHASMNLQARLVTPAAPCTVVANYGD